MLWLMKVSLLLKRLVTLTAILMAAAGHGFATERPLSSESLNVTLSDAHKVAVRHADMQVLRIAGTSMLPFFGDGSVVIVKKIDATNLRVGMVVVYLNRFGETVAHRLISAGPQGWTAQGYNNAEADSTPVTDENLLGVVYATFHSNGVAAPTPAFAALNSSSRVALAAPAR